MAQCLSEKNLRKFCKIVGEKYGNDREKTCSQIIAKIYKDERCIKKDQLRSLARELSVKDTGTKKDIISRLRKTNEKVSIEAKPKTRKQEEKERTIVRKSIHENVSVGKTVGCSQYGNPVRDLVVVSIPKYALNNQGGWNNNGASIGTAYVCKNCPFYLSSGTSNTNNFPGIWFPFVRIQEKKKEFSTDMHRGWISKVFGLHREGGTYGGKEFWPGLEKMGVKRSQFLEEVFFEKFSHWWQVQISAALPLTQKSLWNSHKELIVLKQVALTMNYESFEGWLKPKKPIVTRWAVGKCEKNLHTPEEVNSWLAKHNALCVKSG